MRKEKHENNEKREKKIIIIKKISEANGKEKNKKRHKQIASSHEGTGRVQTFLLGHEL